MKKIVLISTIMFLCNFTFVTSSKADTNNLVKLNSEFITDSTNQISTQEQTKFNSFVKTRNVYYYAYIANKKLVQPDLNRFSQKVFLDNNLGKDDVLIVLTVEDKNFKVVGGYSTEVDRIDLLKTNIEIYIKNAPVTEALINSIKDDQTQSDQINSFARNAAILMLSIVFTFFFVSFVLIYR
jgi:hypothetical protein